MRYSSYESAQGNNYSNLSLKKNWNNRLTGINYDWLWSWHKMQEETESKPPIKINWKYNKYSTPVIGKPT